jgi:Flp pilus assembly pilin Flp
MDYLKKIARDQCGQDLAGYALMAGFVAVAAVAIVPGIAASLSAALVANANLMIRLAATALAVAILALIISRRRGRRDY